MERIGTYRLAGSCLLLPCTLFTGSNVLILSEGKSAGKKDDCDSSSCKSAETTCDGDASPEAYLRQHLIVVVPNGLASLTVSRTKVDDSSRNAIVAILKSLLSLEPQKSQEMISNI